MNDAPPHRRRAESEPSSAIFRWVHRLRLPLLLGVTAVGAVARSGGLSSGTLYRDDAWVALTTRVPLSTAARMVVTTPGFVLGERLWIGWFPTTLWAEQLPTFAAAVLGIVAVYALARSVSLGAGASLVAAGVVAVALDAVVYATRIKPYAFDLLAACLVMYLGERVRRGERGAAWWLAAASVAVCAFSLTPVPLVVGVWAAIAIEALVRRRLTAGLAVAGAATAAGLGGLWLAVRSGISPRLRTSWDGHYLVVSSLHGLVHSARTIVDGLVAGVGDTTPQLGLHGLGQLDRVAIIALAVLGAVVAVRRQLLPIAALLAAAVLSVPSLVPLGTGRTDVYLYPAIALLVAQGASSAIGWLARHARPAATVAVVATVAFGCLVAVDRLVHRPAYPGGDVHVVASHLEADLAHGEAVVIGGTARWPWSYYEAAEVTIRSSDLYNNGYYPVDRGCLGCKLVPSSRIYVLPGSAIEGGYPKSSAAVARAVRDDCDGVAYVESDDWPSMPMTLLQDLERIGDLEVTDGPVVVDGYRYWELRTTAPCPIEPLSGR